MHSFEKNSNLGSNLEIGRDCMFSNNVIVRTSDSHAIYDLHINQRINKTKSISIGNYVWIVPQSIIMKGVAIGDGSIIGFRSFVNKNIPECCNQLVHLQKV